MTQKIIVVGDINGQLEAFFDKLNKLHAKQDFTFALIAGDLFADVDHPTLVADTELDRLLKGEITLNVPTYFTPGKRALPSKVSERLQAQDGELVPNLICLSRRSRHKTSEGVKILSIAGVHREGPHEDELTPYDSEYTDKEVFQCISFNDADILITSDWPADVKAGSSVPCAGPATEEVPSLAKLCSEIKPRYHFSTSPAFFEREPFLHPQSGSAQDGTAFTRFIAIAPFGNEQKEKALYAFNLQSQDDQPPAGTTPTPFAAVTRKRKLESQETAFNSFRFGQPGNGEYRGKRRRHAANMQPQQCYFCLSNPACEVHMVCSIGDNAYVTIAKGSLTERSTYEGLGIPGHMLIIPLVHAPTLSSIPDHEVRAATGDEMAQYSRALHKMISAQPGSALGSITWAINRSSGVHVHYQFLPMQIHLLKQGVVESAFKAEADALDYPAFRDESPEREEVEESDHFKLTLRWGDEKKELAMPLDQSFRFDLQFGRRVLGKLLRLSHRADWRDCPQAREDEEGDVLRFKEMFKPYDFSLET